MVANIHKTNNAKEMINFVIALSFMFFFRFIPAPDPITPWGMAVLGVFIGAIWGWCFGGDSTLWASLLALVALGIGMPAGAFGAVSQVFSGYVFIMVLLSLFTVGALMGADIAEYLVYRVLSAKFLKGNPWMLVAMILYGAYVIGILTNPMVVAIFLFSLFEVLFAQAGYQPGEKTPVMLIICTALDILIASILYPWSAPQLMALQVLQTTTGIVISNAMYVILLLLIGMIMLTLMLGMMRLMKCDIDKMSKSDITFLQEKYSKGLVPYQKGVLIAMLFFALGSIVIAFFPKSLATVYAFVAGKLSFIGWMALVAGVMMFIKIDGKRLLEPRVMAAAFPWDMLMMIGVGVTVGTLLASAETGVTIWIGNVLGPILAKTNDLTLCIILAIVGLLLTNVLNNNAVIILLSTAVVTLSVQGFIGDPIIPIIVVICSAEMGFITPAASIYGALIHAHKYVTPSSAYKYGAIMMVFSLLFLFLIVIPLTKLLF